MAMRAAFMFLFAGSISRRMSTSPPSLKSHIARLRNNKNQVLVLDGGTGEELFRRGLPDDRKIWSAKAVVEPKYHSVLKQVHRSFVDAGADAVTTNSYGIVPGVGFSEPEIVQHVGRAGLIARDSVPETTIVLGSLGPLVESYRPDLIMKHNEGMQAYVAMAKALSPYVDCFLAETMSSVEECVQVVDAVGILTPSEARPLMISFTLDGDGNFRSGEAVVEGIRRLLDHVEMDGQVELLAILFNCAEPEAITRAFKRIRDSSSLQPLLSERNVILGAYANRLTPVDPYWTMDGSDGPQAMRDDLSPEAYYSKFVSKWVNDLGVQIVGGCCGITPEHIALLSSKLKQCSREQSKSIV